jgi:hypothetical protein
VTYKYHKDGTLPVNGEVFVFGSNLSGIHGAGAAAVAASKFGAQYGDGRGWMKDFKSYAIPTKGAMLGVLPLDIIKEDIERFVRLTNDDFVLNNGYFVTRVGCGLAGYTDAAIAPMFKGAKNCSFAEEWREYLE